MERATFHYIDNLDNIMKKNNSAYILIPPGITKYLYICKFSF